MMKMDVNLANSLATGRETGGGIWKVTVIGVRDVDGTVGEGAEEGAADVLAGVAAPRRLCPRQTRPWWPVLVLPW